jgi:23S rRNA (cytosine1962-C5)-methyltransferase
MTDINQKTLDQSIMLANRLSKRSKHLRKWAKRTNVFCYRLYDRDIPEIPLAIDLFEDEKEEKYLIIALYERPYEKAQSEEEIWFAEMKKTASAVLTIPYNHIYEKIRRHQKGDNQYEKEVAEKKTHEIIIREQGQRFKINLNEYLDTGLFFDHRPLRLKIRNDCKKKNVLNLYSYTGAFSVYAATGKAKSVCSVDLSNKYIKWAEENFLLNGITTGVAENKVGDKMFGETFLESLPDNCTEVNNSLPKYLPGSKYAYINGDVIDFLYEARRQKKEWDIIILDPPTFSNSKKMNETLDINRDWNKLITLCLRCLTSDGILYFSTNSRRLIFDATEINVPEGHKIDVTDITISTIPEDFKNSKIHRCWQITYI